MIQNGIWVLLVNHAGCPTIPQDLGLVPVEHRRNTCMPWDMHLFVAAHWHSLGSGVLHKEREISIQNQKQRCIIQPKGLDNSCFGSVKAAFADGGCDRVGSFLLSQLLFKLSKLFHGDFLFLIEYLGHTFNLLNLRHISVEVILFDFTLT